MSNRTIAALAIGANVSFWFALFFFAALRPDYSHFTKAVSELGTWGAPNMWAFNALGFIAPGALLALFGWLLVRRAASGQPILAALLSLGGVGILIAGVFPGDMNDFGSITTIAHVAGSVGSLLFWAPALIWLAVATRKTWPALAIASIVAVVVMISAFGLYDSASITRAIVQRLTFGVFYGWYLAAALLLLFRRTPG